MDVGMRVSPSSKSIIVVVAVPVSFDLRLITKLMGAVPKVEGISSSGVRCHLSIKKGINTEKCVESRSEVFFLPSSISFYLGLWL